MKLDTKINSIMTAPSPGSDKTILLKLRVMVGLGGA